jgi:iron complex outermembrane receptor protein
MGIFKMRNTRSCALLVLIGLNGLAGTAVAQDQQAAAINPAGAPGSPADAGRLGEIVVTANKRSENMQSVPISISSVTDSSLASAGIGSTVDLGMVVPSLTFSSSFNGIMPHIRGIGTPPASAGDESSVATYLDGVYIATMGAAMLQLDNIAQVDVLKGPQGTLFGRNATGGVVNVRTKDPTQDFHLSASVSYGNYETASSNIYVTGGLSNTVAADFSAYGMHQNDGFGTNRYTGHDVNRTQDYSLRSNWLITPTDDLAVRLRADHSYTNNNGFTAFSIVPGTGVNIPGGSPYVSRDNDPYDINNAQDPTFTFRQSGVSATIDGETDFAKLTSITAYRTSHKTTLWGSVPIPQSPPPESAGWTEKGQQASQEVQFTSLPSSRISWVVGAFYLYTKIGYQPFSITGPSLSPLEEISWRDYETTNAGALYGQATSPIFTEDTHLTLGARYSIERKAITGDEALNFQPALDNLDSIILTDAGKTFRKPTWRLALDHQFSSQVLGYVSYNTGFKSGVFESLPPGGPNAPVVNPETVDAYEIGVKSEFLDQHVRLNAAAFAYDYKQIQVNVFTATSSLLENGAAARIYGLDFDFTARATSRLSIDLSGSYVHDRFTNFPSGTATALVPISQGGGRVAGSGNLAGNRLAYTPDYTLSMGATYTLPIGEDSLIFNADYAYNDGWYFGADDSDLRQKGYSLLNSQITWKLAKSGLEASIWGKNLTNTVYATFFATANNPEGYSARQLAPPRTYGIALNYRF